MQEFVAIDFETANEQRRSACSVGLVRFNSDGEIDARYSNLLRPHPDVDYFSPINTWIHGITAEDVRDAPQWSDIHEEVVSFIGDSPIVAHYMAFDGFVLSDLASLYGFTPIENRRFCTVRLARKILGDKLPSKSLDEVFGYYYPHDYFEHHVADADAEACGKIFVQMQSQFSFEQLEELCPPTTKGRSRQTQHPGLFSDQLSAEELLSRYGNSPALQGECVVFTGTLKHGQRAAVQQLVVELGGVADKNLTKRTTLLVVGIPNPRSWSEGASASQKLAKASKLREAGSPIEVISEEEFFNRLLD